MPDQHGTLFDARLAHCAGPKRFITDRCVYIAAAARHQTTQINDDSFGRKRFVACGRRTCIFATTAIHAGIEAEQLLTSEIKYGVYTSAASPLHFLYRPGNDRA